MQINFRELFTTEQHGDRVRAVSSDQQNQRIRNRSDESIARHARQPELISRRLRELDNEWDMERTLMTNAASLTLAGLVLSMLVDRRFLALPLAVAGFLLLHGLQGWCPPVSLFRQMGVRTQREIERERYALKAIRGDFDAAAHPQIPARRLQPVLRAVE